jgi:hypothetical protein
VRAPQKNVNLNACLSKSAGQVSGHPQGANVRAIPAKRLLFIYKIKFKIKIYRNYLRKNDFLNFIKFLQKAGIALTLAP